MKATSLDAAKEDLIIDQENSLIIDNKMAKFTEGHYVQNKVRARFYFLKKSPLSKKICSFCSSQGLSLEFFLPIEKHFIESVRFTDKLM